jgi:hypothetical protein
MAPIPWKLEFPCTLSMNTGCEGSLCLCDKNILAFMGAFNICQRNRRWSPTRLTMNLMQHLAIVIWSAFVDFLLSLPTLYPFCLFSTFYVHIVCHGAPSAGAMSKSRYPALVPSWCWLLDLSLLSGGCLYPAVPSMNSEDTFCSLAN